MLGNGRKQEDLGEWVKPASFVSHTSCILEMALSVELAS